MVGSGQSHRLAICTSDDHHRSAILGLDLRVISRLSIQGEKLNVVISSQETNVDALSIGNKSTPTTVIPFFIKDLSLAPLHRQVEIAVICIDAMLHLSPQEDLDGLIVHKDSLTIFGHWRQERGGGVSCLLLFEILLLPVLIV